MVSLAWRREFDWRLQNLLTFSLPVFKRTVRTLSSFERRLTPEQSARYQMLRDQYSLSGWERICTEKELLLNLSLLDLCDRLLPRPSGGRAGARGLDIGSGSWSYLPALVGWSPLSWDGVEIDAHRRYWTLATRRGHAEYMTRFFDRCRYRPGSLLDLDGSYACITWLLPFVTPGAHRAGRLPDRFFQPRLLLRHAWRLLAPGGILFILNQGPEEAEAQQLLFQAEGLAAVNLGEIDSLFSPFKRRRYGSVLIKSNDARGSAASGPSESM